MTRCASLILIGALAGCAEDEPELIARFGAGAEQNLLVAIDGERIHVFYDVLYALDPGTGEVENLGIATGASSRYVQVAVSDGQAYWHSYRLPDGVPGVLHQIGRQTQGGLESEHVDLDGEPGRLIAHEGCALFTSGSSLFRWCAADPAPVAVAASGDAHDVAADDGAYYVVGTGGLVRLDRVTGERTVLAETAPWAPVAVYGDEVAWWQSGEVFAVAAGGGPPIRVGTLPGEDADRWHHLTVDPAGYHRGVSRLRRGHAEGETWLPQAGQVVVADGLAVWVQVDSATSEYRLFAAPSDRDAF